MTQLLMTEARINIDSAILIDDVFHNHFSDNPDCGILGACSIDNCATFVKLPYSCKKYDDTGTR